MHNPFDLIDARLCNIETLLSDIKHGEAGTPNNRNPKNEEYLSRKEAATLLRVSLPTLDRRIKEGALKSYLVGNKILLKRDELQAAPEERKFTV